nr:hypothetical protein [Tanacetum cinerariifolium]
GKHRKIRAKVAWETIKDLTQYEDEEWDDLIFHEEGTLDYIDGTSEQVLENTECQVESLMKSEVLLDYEGGFLFPERPYLEEFEGRILNLLIDREDQSRKLK